MSEAFAVPISAYLMTLDPWIPFLIGPAMMFVNIVLAMVLLPSSRSAKTDETSRSATRDNTNDLGVAAIDEPIDSQLNNVALYIKQYWGYLFIALIFLTSDLGKQSMGVLLQYVAIKFRWSYARVSHTSWHSCNYSISSHLLTSRWE